MGLMEQIKECEAEIKSCKPENTAHLGRLRARLAKYKTEMVDGSRNTGMGGGSAQDFDVVKSGDARVAMIGFPSVGKSSLLSKLTDKASEVGAHEFTTLTAIPGKVQYQGANIQLIDLPGIIQGAATGKGRGKNVIQVARNADMILMMLDASRGDTHRAILENELYQCGIRLNTKPADIYFVRKKTGGIKWTATVKGGKITNGLDEKGTRAILQEYKIHNCEVIIKEDATVDQFIDIVEANRKYLPCLYVYNKVDCLCLEELAAFAMREHSLVISIHWELNLELLLAKTWDYLNLLRIYTKKRGSKPDFTDPVILRAGSSVEDVSRAFPSCARSILTEIYLCHACSCQEIEDGNAARAGMPRRAQGLGRPGA
jgi:small GTP-binding protein